MPDVATSEVQPDATTTPTQPDAPSLIATSSASRANYADNVTALGQTNANIGTQPSPTQTPRYDGSNVYNQPDGKGGFYSGPIAQAPGTLYNVPDGNGGFYTGAAAGAPTSVGTPATGTPAPVADTTDPATATPGVAASGTAAANSDVSDPTVGTGLPPGLASAYKQSLDAQDQGIRQAKDTLASFAATVANDPAATQAANVIQAQYDVLINDMKERNRQVIGRATVNAARSGGLQYANDMTESFMSNEMDRASGRIADLVSKEQALILRSNSAYKSNDIKAFDAAQTALDKVSKEKTDTLGKLLTATNDHVKEVQAQQRLDMATKKSILSTDVTASAKIADAMVSAVHDAGLKSQADIDAYINAMATKNNITNTDILKSAYVAAQQKAQKTALSEANTASIIQKRGTTGSKGSKASTKGNGTDGSFSYTQGDVGQYANLLNHGGTGPNGTSFGKRGSDGYVDPGAYTAALNDWVGNGGTPNGFAKKFPVKGNVNPSSYDALPAAIHP